MHIIKNLWRGLSICLLIVFSPLFIFSNAYSFPYKGLDIEIQGTITEMYDDNITYAKYNKKADFITTLGFGLDTRYEGKNRSLEFSGLINQRLHAKFSDIKSSSESLSINFSNEFSVYDRMMLSYKFIHSQIPVTFEEEFGRIKGRQESFDNTFSSNYARDISEHFSVNTMYTYSISKFSEKNIGDFSYHNIYLNTNYLYTPATTFFMSYSFTKYSSDVASQTPTLGIKKYLTKSLYLETNTGVDITTYSNNKKTINHHINSSLVNELDENTMSLLFNKSELSVPETGDVFSSWRITGRFARQISRMFNSSFSAFYGRGTFVLLGAKDTLLGVDISSYYTFSENMDAGFTYTYTNFDSTDEIRGYTKNMVSTRLILKF